MSTLGSETDSRREMRQRAQAIRSAGSLEAALAEATIPKHIETTLSEALILGLLKQGVRKYLVVFGHGSTELGDALRVYEEEGVTRTFNCRNEVAMAHAATMLRWQYREISAVVTSIGPGALQAFAGSLSAASNGVGIYHIYGDETTFGEGYNMQQVPKPEQGLYGRLTAIMGGSYVLHTAPALRDALRRGALAVNHPFRAGPFFLLLPLNVQPVRFLVNLAALPTRPRLPVIMPEDAAIREAADMIAKARRVTIKAGGGTRGHDSAVRQLAEAAGAAVTLSPGSTGVLPDDHPQNMHVGGSKGSISGNFAMANADLLVVMGSRGVCQADCSGIGYKSAEAVINVNGEFADALHYNRTLALPGDIGGVARCLTTCLAAIGDVRANKTGWLSDCAAKKAEWAAFKRVRYQAPPLLDEVWQRPVLTQPVAIKIVADFAAEIGAVKYFDAGDVQANGFQIVEDQATGETFTEAGASYMGFAPSALLASALSDHPRYGIAFCGDGSFIMNPQILVDGVEHGVRGMIVIFDNRRMAAISALQRAQYGHDFHTNDGVAIDYVGLAAAVSGVCALRGGFTGDELRTALRQAYAHHGLSVVHVPVYWGPDELGGLGAWGEWNVGNWCEHVEAAWVRQDL